MILKTPWGLTKQILQIEATLKKLGWIKRPIIDWVATDAPDPSEAYATLINGHVIGIHVTEEAARNHAWLLTRCVSAKPPRAGRVSDEHTKIQAQRRAPLFSV